MKQILIESKVFEVVRDGRFVYLIEKGWKVVKEIRLGLGTARWFVKVLEDCLKTVRKEFYSVHKEGDRGYVAQRRHNSRGSFMALMEYGGGGYRNFLFIPKDREGRGWRKLVEIMREAAWTGGLVFQPPQQPPFQSYREALLPKGSTRGGHSSDILACSRGGVGLQRSATTYEGVQAREKGDRVVVGLFEEKELRALLEMKCQIDLLQLNINWMLRCVEEKKWMGLGLGVGCGPNVAKRKGVPAGEEGSIWEEVFCRDQFGKKNFAGHEEDLKGKKIAHGSGPSRSPLRVGRGEARFWAVHWVNWRCPILLLRVRVLGRV